VTIALRYTRLALLGDVVVMVLLAIGLSEASTLGFDIQPLKWAMVFCGGALMMLAVALSLVAIVLQIAVGFQPRSKVN